MASGSREELVVGDGDADGFAEASRAERGGELGYIMRVRIAGQLGGVHGGRAWVLLPVW